MSEPIRVNDLVVAVKGCPKCSYRKGLIFTVTDIGHPILGYWCEVCKWSEFNEEVGAKHHHGGRIPLSWLRRIPPLSELESSERKEEAPA